MNSIDIAKSDNLILSNKTIKSLSFKPLPAHLIKRLSKQKQKGLNDVIKQIKANLAWQYSRGQGVHIAIIDTGICETLKEIPLEKRSILSWPNKRKAWYDKSGHGSMVATIAAGTTSSGGIFNGVAPDANIISCLTDFSRTSLYIIYKYLISLVENGIISRLVINNSYGIRTKVAPQIDHSDLFIKVVKEAVAKGIVVVFPAGNNHFIRCGFDPTAHGPNSIWGANSLDEVICVGTVDEMGQMNRYPNNINGFSHCDSSRGPGQLSLQTIKPDCTAPTYGEIIWGNNYITNNWWGTSGATAQVSGLAALLLAKNPALTPYEIQQIIKTSCTPLPLPPVCVGTGLIDCYTALKLIS